ncbi:hypothetical protein [Pseudoxanthomonas winnipegensis]|uniref:Uncharacterized protein n=1 Tax=Pseudoxanthomonas winnipegensis TaxID=2480810 RepID=A0A4Q8LFZ7_9GAMM|nr:hypothetical protein [Pseudoxanthomonas winnipegensis]RZZ81867.1 hypothetical protein EA662_16960 [Pseudoxanthomonas winnipegensis]TAA27813.1 hypothetical protein EA661_13865 [Pseudoxanthomonas winnipegensis]TAA42264.1 hypothetical protein EAT51_08345 [Pseudoxanthomonas winnipegensis]TBV71004.1 hypothetical protein EYC46_18140 [Pseudoxanthomonas winnipegensis]
MSYESTPWSHAPQLTGQRLRVIAEILLETLYDTELELSGDLDDNYVRGSATFGRQRNAIIRVCQQGRYDWIKLTHAGMDVTFEIEGIPCRFFADDPANPKKPGFYRRNDADRLLFEVDTGKPEMFRFVVVKPETAEEEADVHFIGFDGNLEQVFRWKYSQSTPALASVDDTKLEAVELPPARAMIPKAQQEDRAAGDESHEE